MFDRAAEPGEWAVPGGFAFWDEDPAALTGRRRQAFRAGFLGLGSFGWSTLVEVAEAAPGERAAGRRGAGRAHPRRARRARPRRRARGGRGGDRLRRIPLRHHPPGTVLALARSVEEGGTVRERFRTLHRRDGPPPDRDRLPVFRVVEVEGEDEPPERPDLTTLARAGAGR